MRFGLAFFLALTLSAPAAPVLIVAHRGASHDAPENTMAAQRLAWQQGAEAVETDIHFTKDRGVIVIHDATVKRTTGAAGAIAELTLAEARRLDAGTWKAPRFAGEKLPLLAEQLAEIPAGKRIFVEIKIGPEIVPELKGIFAAARADERNVTVISFNYESLKAVRQQLPRLPTQYLVGYRVPDPKAEPNPKAKKQPTLDEVIAQAKAAKLTGLDLQHTWPLTKDDVARIRAAGLELHVWTVDDVAVARRWIELGVDSITTNRPGWLREQLKL